MIQSHTGGDWVKTRQRSVTSNGFQVKMEEDNLDIGHNTEIYGWIALPAGSGSLGGIPYEALVTPDQVTHVPYTVTYTQSFDAAPAFFAAMHTFDGGDPSHMRQSSVTATNAVMWVEEETCTDAELAHTTETIGVLVIQEGVIAVAGSPIEVGMAEADIDSVVIPFANDYTDPIVIAGIPTHNGDAEVAIRLTGVRDTSFTVYSDVPNRCGDSGHVPESFGWLITNSGQFGDMEFGQGTYGICAGGSLCTAALGCPTCDHSTGFDWVDVAFTVDIESPVVVSQIQSHTGGNWVKTRQRSVTNSGFQMKQEEDGMDAGHNTEVYGWMAVPAGVGDMFGAAYEAIVTPDVVTRNKCHFLLCARASLT